MATLKDTSFLEAVAAGIEHEKDFFEFCMKTHDELNDGPIKDFFYDLGEDSEEHIRLIEGIYKQYSGNNALPNLKHLGMVHKFQATAIQRLIKKLDRNLRQSAHGNEIEALRLALQEAEDALHAFNKLAGKFSETPIKMLFKQMANFNSERAVLLEGSMVYHARTDHDAAHAYHTETMNVPLEPHKPARKQAAKAAKPKGAAKKKVRPAPRKKAKPKAKPKKKMRTKK
jgi:rubrerythrin